MTATDIAVASVFCNDIGDKEKLLNQIPEEVRVGALNEITRQIEAAIDRVKVLWGVDVDYLDHCLLLLLLLLLLLFCITFFIR